MTANVQTLEVPPDVQENGGTEILRVFISDGGASVSLIRAFDDPETWGILMVDLVRHVARSYASQSDLSEEEIQARILEMANNELNRPTDLGSTTAVN